MRVTVLGTGAMGAGMARSLLREGFAVTVPPARPATATMTWRRSTSDSDCVQESVVSMMTMKKTRSVRRFALVLIVLVMSSALGSATAAAAELSDYRWERRPLLIFAPTDSDPRLVETLSRIEASRCDFVGRDMVLGVVVTQGTSTLGGEAVNADESQRLMSQYAIGENAFSAVLIGKDGGEKLRMNEIPDLQQIYAVIDGMPMRSREMNASPGRC